MDCDPGGVAAERRGPEIDTGRGAEAKKDIRVFK